MTLSPDCEAPANRSNCKRMKKIRMGGIGVGEIDRRRDAKRGSDQCGGKDDEDGQQEGQPSEVITPLKVPASLICS